MIFSKFLYDTGARLNEAQRLEWTDINEKKNQVTVKASKNGKSRILDVSENLIQLLKSLHKKSDLVFVNYSGNRSASFHNRVVKLARKYNNPRLKKISLHTFRHCKALREYHKTRDVLYVMAVLGHRDINTTYGYVEIYNQIYKPQQQVKYMSRIASTKEERCELINNDWQLVGKDGEDWYFKKPE